MTVSIRRLGEPGDLGWVVMAHGEIYARQFGWDVSFEALVARIVADYAAGPDPAREAAWIAEADGQRAGCVFCIAGDDDIAGDDGDTAGDDGDTAQLRILLVDPCARGLGIGSRLVAECICFARQAGYRHMVLWTNDPLTSAARIYLAAGFRLAGEQEHHSFGRDLVGQNYALDLGLA